MKLYGLISSERATKGQGGQWLDISVQDEKHNQLMLIKVRKVGNKHSAFIDLNKALINMSYEFIECETKGKRQKDEWSDIDITTGELIPRAK